MKKNLIVFLSVLLPLILFQLFLLYLFPNTGLGIVYSFLESIAASIMVGLIFAIINSEYNLNKFVYIVCLVLIYIVLIFRQISNHPSDIDKEPLSVLSNAFTILKRYPNNIEYRDIFSGNDLKSVAALYKYKSSLHDSSYLFAIYMNEIEIDSCMINFISGENTSDNTHFKFMYPPIDIEYSNTINKKNYKFKFNRIKFNRNHFAYQKLDTTCTMAVVRYYYKVEQPYEKLFYFICLVYANIIG